MFDYDVTIENLYLNDLIYSQTPQLTAHNAYASIEDGWVYHPMQQYDFVHQFYMGARAFMIDVYNVSDELVLLHNENIKMSAGVGSSLIKTFYFEDFLRGIKNLLDNNEKSVITLIIENKVSHQAIKQALGNTKLVSYLLLGDPNDRNLKLKVMRESNQRLVIFAENGNKSEDGIYTTQHYKETTYSLGSDKLCVDRQERRVPFDNKVIGIFILNHFYMQSCTTAGPQPLGASTITNPFKPSCQNVNDYDAIMARVTLCQRTGNNATFIAVDFLEQGNNGGALKFVSDLINPGFYDAYLKAYAYKQDTTQYDFRFDTGTALTIVLSSIIVIPLSITIFWHCYLKYFVLPYYEIRLVQGGNGVQPYFYKLPLGGKLKRY